MASLLGREAEGALLLAGVLRVPAHLERAVAAVLGARLGQIVLPDTARAVEAIRWLSQEGAGSATVLPHDPERRATVIVPPGRRLVEQIEVDPDHWALAEAVLGNVLLADDLDEALALWRDAAASGHGRDARRGGGRHARGGHRRKRAAARGDVAGARARAARADARRARGGSGARGCAAGARRGPQRHGSRRARRSDRRTSACRRCGSICWRPTRIASGSTPSGRASPPTSRSGALEASGLAGADGQVAGELAALDESFAAAAATLEERRAALVRCQEGLAVWRSQHAAADDARTAAAVHATAVAERRRGAEAEHGRLAGTAVELTGRVAVADDGVAAARTGAQAASDDARAAEEARAAAEARAGALAAEREELVAAVAAAEAALSDDDRRQREVAEIARRRADPAFRDRSAAGGAPDGAGAARRAPGRAIRPGPGRARSGQRASPPRRTPRAPRSCALASCVSATSIQARSPSCEEVRGRHEFLAAQRDDLERSLDDLRQTIGKLARTSRRRFDETFAAANDRLAEVFPKLFPEGSARLETTQPEEGGEEGVEIVVALPGKKLQSLSLLSGGEKALTATALVFSLFLIRPTPFCLLDEVDAPLDEANIGRFNALVAEMAERSQFVLITHNRRTMEVAETLYGVTMEQAGVSKVVSVRLSEAA